MEISVDNLSLHFGANQVLAGLNISFSANRFTGIIGANGSGKSTLLKCIYRVLHPSTGAIFLDGCHSKKMTSRETARLLGVVAQHNAYNFEFSVAEIVLMGRSPHKKLMEQDSAEDFSIVEQALKRVGLSAYRERLFSTLSGGEQQRVILARALAQQTRALILDEPTNHLDIRYQFQLLSTVKKLGLTVIAAIHDLNLAALYCDEIYALHEGKIIASGSPEEVLTVGLVQQLYGVDAEIGRNREGKIFLQFYPQGGIREGRIL